LQATSQMLKAEFGTRPTKTAQIITAGVGSGKTFAFAIPVFVSALARLRAGDAQRRTCLLLYPRKALARDQSYVFNRIRAAINRPMLDVHFEHFEEYQNQPHKETVRQGIARVFGTNAPPPAIIITTFETLKQRLSHPLFIGKVAQYLNRVVVDEIHLV